MPKSRMLRTTYLGFTCGLLVVVLMLGSSWMAYSATRPQILSVRFPPSVAPLSNGQGSVQFKSPTGVEKIQLDVVDGRYYRQIFKVVDGGEQGTLQFALPCTLYAQSVTLRLTLWDKKGSVSEPQSLTFNCGQPPHYNFSRVLAESMPIGEWLRLNVVILDDGVTTLTDGAIPTLKPAWSKPSARMREILQRDILPALGGIWDQCGLGFELGDVRIAHAEQLDTGGASLAQRLLSSDQAGNTAILHSRAAGMALRNARQAWEQELAREGTALSGRDLVVFVTGARILTLSGSQQLDIEGFSESGGYSYTLVRWGAVYDQGASILLPRQMVSTLAHELGHLLGLDHPDNDAIMSRAVNEYNLMKGSGVTPEPRAQLLPDQCNTASNTVQYLKSYTPAPIVQEADVTPTAAAVSGEPIAAPQEARGQWMGVTEGQVLKGKVGLGVEVSGLTFTDFGFAEFTYSRDGTHFIQIALDREPADGFSVVWSTRSVLNGRYLLRVAVTDSLRQRMSLEVWVEIKN